ncbi:hypothetical protein [Streptomyces sp. NPDC047071]
MNSLALFLPEAGAIPPWLRITAGVVVLGLAALRVWFSIRRRR